MTQAVFETTATALREKSKLQRHFRRFDVFFYLICTVVTIDTIGAVASNGAQGFTWLIFLGVLFFLPYALSVAELGSAFPQEGGPYIWSRLAFGRPLAAVNSVIYWISNPIWIGGSLTIVSFAAIEEFFGPIGAPGSTCTRWPSSGSPSVRRSSRCATASGCRRSAPGPAARS